MNLPWFNLLLFHGIKYLFLYSISDTDSHCMMINCLLIFSLLYTHHLSPSYNRPHPVSSVPDKTMSWLSYVVVHKANKATQRQRLSSQSSDNSEEEYHNCVSTPSVSRDHSPNRGDSGDIIRLKNIIGGSGGFSYIVSDGGQDIRQIFGFPTRIVSSSQREQLVREFVFKLYNISGDNKNEEVNKILGKLAPTNECKKQHLTKTNQVRSLVQNVEILPTDGFKKPSSGLAVSTPGPRLCTVPNIYTPHTATDSLRVITHLQLSDDDCRYIRGVSMVGLSSEYAVKKLRTQLMGNQGQGWVKTEKLTLNKWFRTEANEIKNYKRGEPAKKEIIIGKIPKRDLNTAVKHWAEVLTSDGQYCDMQTLDNCPDILKDTVILVVGNDSGQGFTREGIRFCNRKSANSGAKVFVSTVMIGSDKSLSNFQKQYLFSSLSELKTLRSISMGGKERKVIKFSCMDYEAAAQDVGTQVIKYLCFIIKVLLKSSINLNIFFSFRHFKLTLYDELYYQIS